jgi:hypothetical protein
MHCSKQHLLFDPSSALASKWADFDTKRLRGPEIDHNLEIHWHLGRRSPDFSPRRMRSRQEVQRRNVSAVSA